MDYVELFGYFAMFLVGASFLLKDVIKLRFVNAVGCACFTIYGLMIGSLPVAGLNFFVTCTNLYFFIKHMRERA